MEQIGVRLAAIRAQIEQAARRAGRDPQHIRLIGVSKTHPPEMVRAALAAGLSSFGENRLQEAEAKLAALADIRPQLEWHLIGHLQTNKAKKAVALFDLIHSVDSLRLAEVLSRSVVETGDQRQETRDKRQETGDQAISRQATREPQPSTSYPPTSILLQVNVSGEASKTGFDMANWQAHPAALAAFLAEVEQLLALPGLAVRGLMTIAPWGTDPGAARPVFRALRLLSEQLAQRFPQAEWAELSMGMSDDFAVAIEEGATMVRVGRAIFGER